MDYVKNEVKLRRELHQIPELGWGEFCTTAKILETIEPLGWKTYAGVEQVGLDAVMGRPEDFPVFDTKITGSPECFRL